MWNFDLKKLVLWDCFAHVEWDVYRTTATQQDSILNTEQYASIVTVCISSFIESSVQKETHLHKSSPIYMLAEWLLDLYMWQLTIKQGRMFLREYKMPKTCTSKE